MDFLLNELSLCGQFDDVDSFLNSLVFMAKCVDLIHNNSDLQIFKTQDFYNCKVTKTLRLCDLKNHGISDELLRFKIKLDEEIYEKPMWDSDPIHDIEQKFVWNGKDVFATSLAEAVARKGALLSFQLEAFKDCVLSVCREEKIYEVISVHTPGYLTEQYRKILHIDRKTFLMIRYEKTRMDCSTLEIKDGADKLEKNEFKDLISTLDKFIGIESWEEIGLDDGLEYKKYTPNSKSEDWFSGGKYRGKTIMKFRFSSVLRCFGYRKEDRFRLLRIERNHKISDNG